MLNFNEKMSMIKALDAAIVASKSWSDVAHKTFADMAEKARDDVTLRGDFSFIRAFRIQFGIGEPTQPLNNRTLETQFNIMLQPISAHFAKFAREYEQAAKRTMYMDMLRSGRKDEFIQIMRSCLGVHNSDQVLTQECWRDFNAEERERERQRQEEESRARLANARVLKQRQDIEAEAKRRIEKEMFETEVEAKVRELKASR